METVLYIVHVLVCLGLLPVILLQSGKGGGVSAVFGGGGAGTVFGSRAGNFLTKLTSGAAIVFMCTSLGLSWYSSRARSVVGDVRTSHPAPEGESMNPSKESDQAANPNAPPPAEPADPAAEPAPAAAPAGGGEPAPAGGVPGEPGQ